MAHNPTHRRKLATPASPSISQNTGKRHPKPSATSTSTVYNLTNHFSRLLPNPKPTNSHNPLPLKHIDFPLQVKALSKSANNLESSHPSFGQDIRKPGKRVAFESGKHKSLVGDEKDIESKKESKKVERESNKGGERNKAMVVKAAVSGDGMKKRRSFSDAQVELANFLATNSAKVVAADMPPFMQIHAVGFARKTKDSLEKFSSKSLALSLKKELDGVYGPAWHCIVGTSFGSFVTHSVGGFLYFSLDQKLYVLLFKTAVQRAD